MIEIFKQAMRRHAAAINLITTEHDGVRYGMAATAVCSLGVSPPSLLVCVATTASIHQPLMDGDHFAVNILRECHAPLVGAFSGQLRGEARFELGEWKRHSSGLPLLIDAQANMICRIAERLERSGHSILIGTVEDAVIFDEVEPLLYRNGALAVARPHSESRYGHAS
jgi:flavin reductase